ncbi:unnamed protein product, partial [Effrenium voratum]
AGAQWVPRKSRKLSFKMEVAVDAAKAGHGAALVAALLSVTVRSALAGLLGLPPALLAFCLGWRAEPAACCVAAK